jgi:murein DD-endopeptidase MepM/ murein hydrolase activator NlpD
MKDQGVRNNGRAIGRKIRTGQLVAFNSRKFASIVAAAAAAFLAMGASPAAAQGTAASTQLASSVKPADQVQTPLDEGDEDFRQLFASWKSLDGGAGLASAAPRAKVSVPSRMPVGGVTLTSDYGMRTHPVLGGRRNHKGVDLAGPVGTPVYATADGLVSKAERFSSYGNYIQIEHGGEMQTRYAHLSGYAVRAGDKVHKGDLIGYVGSTGRSTGPHLHYEVRIAGEAVNPVPYMLEATAAPTQFALAHGEGGMGGD